MGISFPDPSKALASPSAQSDYWLAELAQVIRSLNDRYFFVSEGGKALIYERRHDPIFKGRVFYNRSALSDFRSMYLNTIVKTGEKQHGDSIKEVFETKAEAWLKSPDRHQYLGGIVFDPNGRHDADQYNLWQGFHIKPKPGGSWALLKDLMLNTQCGGNVEHFDYLFGWIARMFQKPAERAETAVVMRSDEGTGKGTLARVLMHMVGHHAFRISNTKHLVGNFNAHLRDCLFLFADEAFFAGDPSQVGVLKSLITEDMLTVEGKFQNAVNAANMLHVFMASNNDWVVPADATARRYFVLDVLDNRIGDYAFFNDLLAEMEAGGYEAFMHDLMAYDLSGFNVRAIPQTEALQEQKKLSLHGPEAWWMDCLTRGYVYKSTCGLETVYFQDWHDTETTELLYASYEAFAKAKHERRPLSRVAFGKWFLPMTKGATKQRNAVVGEHMTDIVTGYDSTGRRAAILRKERATGYSLGTLKAARAAFARETKLTNIAWPDDEGA